MALAHENSSLNSSCYYSGPTKHPCGETFAPFFHTEPVRPHSTVPESTPYFSAVPLELTRLPGPEPEPETRVLRTAGPFSR